MSRNTKAARSLRAKRKAAKMSQDKLARLAGLSVSTVSKIEQGVHEPSDETSAALAAALGGAA